MALDSLILARQAHLYAFQDIVEPNVYAHTYTPARFIFYSSESPTTSFANAYALIAFVGFDSANTRSVTGRE